MRKLFVLLFCSAFCTLSFAQSDKIAENLIASYAHTRYVYDQAVGRGNLSPSIIQAVVIDQKAMLLRAAKLRLQTQQEPGNKNSLIEIAKILETLGKEPLPYYVTRASAK
jgi:hypothetical protein